MIVILHVIIALSSIALASYAFMRPSASILRISYGLVGMTFASGFYLVWSAPAHMLQACISGVVYITVVSVAIVAAKHKLVAVKNNI
jgi:hypothetical protein